MVQVEIDTDKNQQPGYLDKDWLRHEAGYALLSGGVELYFRTAQRLLVLKLGDHRDRLFKIRLPGKPDPDGEWSDWQKVDFIGLPNQPQTVPPTAADPFEIRSTASECGGNSATLALCGISLQTPRHQATYASDCSLDSARMERPNCA